MGFKQFVKELNGRGIEGELVSSFFYSLTASAIVLAIAYMMALKDVEGFIPKYGIYLFFSVISYALIMTSTAHVKAYNQFACMSGMMIGMTVGMIAGFLPGFYAGATNGMFYGGFFGVAVGMIFGIFSGKCCGIMGIMEGAMAGFMGGLMGAMTSVMMINEHVGVASLLVFLISSFILLGLDYMIYRETREYDKRDYEGRGFVIISSAILTVLTIWLMVFGPRSALLK